MRDELLLYYERELDYMRKSAAQFAEKSIGNLRELIFHLEMNASGKKCE